MVTHIGTTPFAFAVLAGLVTYLSGKQAVDSVMVPMNAELTASYHADVPHTLLYLAVIPQSGFFLFWKNRRQTVHRHSIIPLLGWQGVLCWQKLQTSEESWYTNTVWAQK